MKKNLLLISVMILFLSGCASLPKEPPFPDKCVSNQCATFKLMRVNKAELGENRLGNDSMIRINGKYGIYIPKKWENFKAGFWAGSAYYYFNDDAVFSLPAGNYVLEYLVAIGLESAPRSDAYRAFQAKAGAKYEIWVYFINTSKKTSYNEMTITRGLKIMKILEVTNFRDNEMYIGETSPY